MRRESAPSERSLRLVDGREAKRGWVGAGDRLAALAVGRRVEELERELGALLGRPVRLVFTNAKEAACGPVLGGPVPGVQLPGAPAEQATASAGFGSTHMDEAGDVEAPPPSGWRVRPGVPRQLGARLSQVAELLLEGRCDKEIAARLGVQHATARTYVQRLCRQLGVSGRGGVLRLAMAGELILTAAPTGTPR